MSVPVCHNLSMIRHLPNLTMNQFSVILCIANKETALTNDIASVLGYESNEVTKIISYIINTSAKRPALLKGERCSKGNGRGNPKKWSLTEAGQALVNEYKSGIMDMAPTH